ncbi:pilin [Pseudoalteromonas sp. 2CM28B]|nr:pilin [Pseudoalteromonas sp. 2CM28B]
MKINEGSISGSIALTDLGINTKACSSASASSNNDGSGSIIGKVGGGPKVNTKQVELKRTAAGTWSCESDADAEHVPTNCTKV